MTIIWKYSVSMLRKRENQLECNVPREKEQLTDVLIVLRRDPAAVILDFNQVQSIIFKSDL